MGRKGVKSNRQNEVAGVLKEERNLLATQTNRVPGDGAARRHE